MKNIISAFMVTLILAATLIVAFDVRPVKAAGTIYIRADGSIDPPTANITSTDNVTYTFTDNNYDSIVVEKSNIVIDGAGYTLQGSGSGNGFDWSGINNVTIQNTNIMNFNYGIRLSSSPNNTISGNTMAHNDVGIYLYSSSGNSVSSNTMTSNEEGVRLDFSSSNSVNGNTFNNDGLTVWDSYQNVVEDNTVNGKPLVYLEDVADYTVGDAGQVILINCTGIRVEYLNPSSTSIGVQLWQTTNSGIAGNTIVASNDHGIRLFSSSNNSIRDNTIVANDAYGIYLDSSSNNSVSNNTIIANSEGGIGLSSANHSSVSGNTIAGNPGGIVLSSSHDISINGNTITDSVLGVVLSNSFNNTLCHNNVVDSTQHVMSVNSTSMWDDGYPGGGNFWSPYTDIDSYKGEYQDEAGDDGIWDHPYVIDADNQDRYPLTRHYGGPAGDVDGDRDVDIFDIVRMAGAYGVEYPNPRYDRLCDMDLDGDIDIFDIVMAAGNYGESW